MPDFIPVAEREGDGVAGYIATRDMRKDGTYPWWYQDPPIPVYAEDLHTLVGFMFTGKGFVPLGVDPNTVPDFDTVAGTGEPPVFDGPSITLYVRNAGQDTRWFTVLPMLDPPQSVGFDAMSGVACLLFPPGSRLALVDRSPADPDAEVVRIIVGPGDPDLPTPTWVDIAAAGGVTTGDGVPTWWPDAPQPCRV